MSPKGASFLRAGRTFKDGSQKCSNSSFFHCLILEMISQIIFL